MRNRSAGTSEGSGAAREIMAGVSRENVELMWSIHASQHLAL
jgi:hypothetical protein